jgi:adenylate cyclase, class 2
MALEIELRYEIADTKLLGSFLEKLQLVGSKRLVDVYLDTVDADLIRKGIYIRIRDNKKLDIKFNRECLTNPDLEIQPYCEEYSFQIPLQQEQMKKFVEVNNDLDLKASVTSDLAWYRSVNSLIEHRVVDKLRTTYKHEDFLIMIDEVKNLGTFLEIELMAEKSDDIEAVKNRMITILHGLPLKPFKTGYDSLILKKTNFVQYVQGRFALEEDKVAYKKFLAQQAQ